MQISDYDQFNKVNKALNIYHGDSSIDSYFYLLSPFEITYEFCSGITEEDYINVVMLSPDYSFSTSAAYHTHAAYFNTRPIHRHSYYELVLVLRGNVTQRIEGKEFICPQGCCYILNPNLCHSENFTEESAVLLIGLSPEIIEEVLFADTQTYFNDEKLLMDHALLTFFDAGQIAPGQKEYLSFIPCHPEQITEKLDYISELLVQTLLFPRLGSTNIIKGLLGLLFHYLLGGQDYRGVRSAAESSPDFLLFSKISHLIEESNGKIQYRELEKELNYSNNYINRIVKKYTEISLYEYSMYFCMKKAARLLVRTDQTISEIVRELGFSNRTHFYRWFKKMYHMTPKAYRQSCKLPVEAGKVGQISKKQR